MTRIARWEALEQEIEKLKNEHNMQLRKQAEEADNIIKRRFGFSAKLIEAELEVQNHSGDCVFYRAYHGLCSSIRMPHIMHKVVGSPYGSIEGDPVFVNIGKPFHKALSLQVTERPNAYCRTFRVSIHGDLTEADKDTLCYKYMIRAKNAFAMTQEEFKAQHELREENEPSGEYFAFDVEYPLEELKLIVKFPEAYPVQPQLLAYLSHGWVINEAEFQRVRGDFIKEANCATITIKKPLHGFRYVIYWDPPSRLDLRKGKENA